MKRVAIYFTFYYSHPETRLFYCKLIPVHKVWDQFIRTPLAEIGSVSISERLN